MRKERIEKEKLRQIESALDALEEPIGPSTANWRRKSGRRTGFPSRDSS